MGRITVVLTVAFVMSFSTSALASVAAGGDDTGAGPAALAPPAQDLRTADARVNDERVLGPTVVFETETVPESGGLSNLAIVLITLGASAALAAAMAGAMRATHARNRVSHAKKLAA
jgi:hypothetical protein